VTLRIGRDQQDHKGLREKEPQKWGTLITMLQLGGGKISVGVGIVDKPPGGLSRYSRGLDHDWTSGGNILFGLASRGQKHLG